MNSKPAAPPCPQLKPAAHKTKKVRMPDGTIKVKVEQPDGTWKWAKGENTKKANKPAITPASADNPPATSTAPFTMTTTASATTKPATSNMTTKPKAVTSLKSAPKKSPAVNIGKVFKVASVLDAVLPEHLKIGHDMAGDIGMTNSDNDDNNSVHSTKGPSSASTKQLTKLAAGGVKVKVKKAKKSVYRPGEFGSSDEEEFDDHPSPSISSPNDDIATIKEKSTVDQTDKEVFEITEKEIQPLKKRPSRGRRLQRRSSRLAQGLAWSIALLFPLLFLIIAIITATMNKKNAMEGADSKGYNFGIRLIEASKICVSMWPILFGAIVAQSFRMYAAWKCEATGIKLVQLEQFIGSHSLATAIKQPFMMMHLDWTAIGMICLWALSPIAGQSFLRMLSIESDSSLSQASHVTFADFSKAMNDPWNTTDDTASAMINLLFGTAILADTSPEYNDSKTDLTNNDPWRQPRTYLSGEMTASYPGGPSPQTALVGQSIYNLPSYDSDTMTALEMKFTIPTSWFSFQCNDPINATLNNFVNDDDWWYDQGSTMWLANVLPDTNLTLEHGPEPATLFIAMNLTSQNPKDFLEEVAVWQCSYYTQYATVNYTCTNFDANCVTNPVYPTLQENATNIYLTDKFIWSWLDSLGTPDNLTDRSTRAEYSQRSILTQFMLDADWTRSNGSANTDPSAVTGIAMQEKLIPLITGYWQLGFTYSTLVAISQGLKVDNLKVDNLSPLPVELTQRTAIFIVHWQWVILLICSCIVLLCFGITGIVLDSRTKGPDILGFATSMTRDNRYIKLDSDIEMGDDMEESSSSSRNAYERMKDMKHHKVMLQDVHGHKGIGKIALASVGIPHGIPLSRDRLYR